MAFSFAFRCLQIDSQLLTFTELPGCAASYVSSVYKAPNSGATECADLSSFRPQIVGITCECAPYTVAGLQRFGEDPRAQQVLHSAQALLDMQPRFFVKESVVLFFTEDAVPRHGMYSAFLTKTQVAYKATLPVYVHDTEAGGSLHRTHGFIFGEETAVADVLPPWVITPPQLTPANAHSYLQPLSSIPSEYIATGTYKRSKVIVAPTAARTPIVVGQLWWGDSSTPLQPGVVVRWKGTMYKADDALPSNPSLIRLIKQQPKGVRKHEQVYVTAKHIPNNVHRGQWYPVFTAFAPLKSPRCWGQLPEGNMCLIEDTSSDPPTVRRLTPLEQYWQMAAAVPSSTQHLVTQRWQQLQQTHASEKQLLGMLAGSITSAMAMWAVSTVNHRLHQFDTFTAAKWHTEVPQQHINSPGMQSNTKRVIMVVFSLWPSPQVLVAADDSMVSIDINSDSREHDSAQQHAERWVQSLGVPTAPFVVGEVAHNGSYQSAYVPIAAPIASIDKWHPSHGARWVTPSQCPQPLALVVNTTIAKAETLVRMTASLAVPSSQARWGAVAASTVTSQAVAPDQSVTPFQVALLKAEQANTTLRQALQTQAYAEAIQHQVTHMESWTSAELNIHDLLSTWIDRVVPQPLTDVPDSFREGKVEEYSSSDLALTPFVSYCDPDHTTWMPLPPNQVKYPGFDPTCEADLYHDFAAVEHTCDTFESLQQQTLESFARDGKLGIRYSNKVSVLPESGRVLGAQGRIFHLTTPQPTLVDFHAPLDTDLNLPFIAHMVGITPPADKSAVLADTDKVTYPDLELVSDLFLGARSKTAMPMHSVFCPHGESLRLNLVAIEDQALELEEKSYASLHSSRPYSPCRYVANGSTERKDDPTRPRTTDNKSAPLKPFIDKDGEWVTSQNYAYKQGQAAPTDTASAPSAVLFPPDPKEKKPALHHIAQDAMVLRHLGDSIDEPVYVCKFDMAAFFDQLPIPYFERHLNLRMLRPQHLFKAASVTHWPGKSTHMAHKRMGFGGTRNSNIGQRFANLIVFVVSYFMDYLEAPHLHQASGYKRTWLEHRKQLNTSSFYRHDRLYTAHMYTDDLIGLTVSVRTAMNFLVAVYLMATHMNVLLAGTYVCTKWR